MTRSFVWLSLAVTLFFAGVSSSARGWGFVSTAPQRATTMTVLHTNDLHGHLTAWQGWEGSLRGQQVGGFATLATHVGRVREEVGDASVLLLDAGDTISDTMLAGETQGRAVIDAMNALNYHAMVIGNHEPDFGPDVLRTRIGEARFAVLAANVTTSGGEAFARPYFIRSLKGIRVGILGLSYPNTPLTSARSNVESLRFRPAAETAREYVPRMRKEGAHIVIALTHLGLGADRQLATEVPDIDLIVGGHSHNRMADALRVGKTLIVQAGAHGSDLGRIDLTVRDGRVVAHRRTLISLLAASSAGPSASRSAVADVVERLRAPYADRMDVRVGRAAGVIMRAQTIAGQEPEARDAESPADDLFADAIREATETEIAFLPGLGYGVALQPGDITAAQLRNLIPHDTPIWTMQLTGGQVREVLEQAIENFSARDATKKVGGMIQVSGLRFTYAAKAAPGNRVLDVTVGDGRLELDRRYRVATNDLLAQGGHGYRAFTEAAERHQLEGPKQYEMVRTWIGQRNEVAVLGTSRIRPVTVK